MSELVLNFDQAHKFVEEQAALGGSAAWDGWDLTFFKAVPTAEWSRLGVYNGSEWGYENRVVPNADGNYLVDFRNIKKRKRNGGR